MRAGLAILVLGLALVPVRAEQARSWREPAASVLAGEAQGVAIGSNGTLSPAPRIERLGDARTPGEPVQTWAMVQDDAGNLFLGTGPDGLVVRVTPSGRATVLYTAPEPLVTALALLPDGALLAATAPGGRIYRIDASGSGRLWCETGERYVWTLVAGRDGSVLAGTGEQGRILEITPSGQAGVWFDGDEEHVVRLMPLADGSWVAGGAGRGLVYRLDAEGHAYVLHDDPLPEVAALARGADGRILAAFIAPPTAEEPQPTLKLRLPDGTEVGAASESAGSLQEASGPLLRGVIEGLPESQAPAEARLRGRLLALGPEGESEVLWSSSTEAPFALGVDRAGRVLLGTGEPARLYRVESDGEVRLLSTLPEAQITRIGAGDRFTHLATSNPSSIYRLEDRTADGGSFVSRPFDAGGPTRWGTIRWRLAGEATFPPEIYTRTGNSRVPDATWSAWSPAQSDPAGSPIDNPDGRYLQWRARFGGAGAAGSRLDGVEIRYAPYNRAPRFESVGDDAPRWVADFATWSWKASDADGDPLLGGVELRRPGSPEPLRVEAESPRSPGGDPGEKEAPTAQRVTWDVADVEEGPWTVVAWLSDESANAPGEGRRVERPLGPVVVDRTPPTIERRPGGWLVRDGLSPIERLEWVEQGTVRFTLRPVDGVCDETTETFESWPGGDGRNGTLRAVDAAGNRAERPVDASETP